MILALVVACNSNAVGDPGCLDRDLDQWCFHEENAEGPMEGVPADASCELPNFVPDAPATRCGDVDVSAVGGGFTGTEQFFDHATGELIAVRYWTDFNHYCGGFSYWYGRRVNDCTAECSYDPASTDLPVCE